MSGQAVCLSAIFMPKGGRQQDRGREERGGQFHDPEDDSGIRGGQRRKGSNEGRPAWLQAGGRGLRDIYLTPKEGA